jgi:RNA-directed DNA polymerase
VAQRVDDADIMHLLKVMLKASGKKGVPQGGVISPLLSNLYLNEVDRMLERAREVTRNGKYTYIEYARFADDLVILIDAYKRHDWLIGAVERRLREEFGKLQVEINDEKSRIVDLERGESFGFLGFDFRYLRSRRGAWRPHYTPKLKKRTALMRELKAVFRRYRSQPIERVMHLINPVLRGWVNYFAVGHSSECFSFIKDWVEKKVRRHLAQAQKRKGFGWERWSRRWLYDTLAELRRFEHFWEPKYLSLLEPTPEGRHYSGVGGTGAAVILGGGWAGSSSLSFCSNRRSSASGSV